VHPGVKRKLAHLPRRHLGTANVAVADRPGESAVCAPLRRHDWPLGKGGKVQTLPVVDPAFWNDLERWILDWQAQPNEYLLCRRSVRPNRHKPGERFVKEFRDEPMGGHGLHDWWYGCLERAGVVALGQTSGERMHKAAIPPARVFLITRAGT
jgi:hypothetical protein